MKLQKFDWLIVFLISYGFFLLLLDQTTVSIFQARDLYRAAELWRGHIFFWGPETNGGGMLPGSFFYLFIGLPYIVFGHWLAVWHYMAVLLALAVALLWRWWRNHAGVVPGLTLVLFMLSSFVVIRSVCSFLNPSFLPLFEVLVLLCFTAAYSRNEYRFFYLGAVVLGLSLQIQFTAIYLALAVVTVQLQGSKFGIKPVSWRVFMGGAFLTVLPSIPAFLNWGLPRPATHVNDWQAVLYYLHRYVKKAVAGNGNFEWSGFHVFHQFYVLLIAVILMMVIQRRVRIFKWPSDLPTAGFILPLFTFLWSLITGAAYLVGGWSQTFHPTYVTGFMVPVLAAGAVASLDEDNRRKMFLALLIVLLAVVNLPSWSVGFALAILAALAGLKKQMAFFAASVLVALGYVKAYESHLSVKDLGGLPIWRDMQKVAKVVGTRPVFGVGIRGEAAYEMLLQRPRAPADLFKGALLVTKPTLSDAGEVVDRPDVREDVKEMIRSGAWRLGAVETIGDISVVPYEVADPLRARVVSNEGVPYWDRGMGQMNPYEGIPGKRVDLDLAAFFIHRETAGHWKISIHGMGIAQPSAFVLPKWTHQIQSPYIEWICGGKVIRKTLASNLGIVADDLQMVSLYEVSPFSQWVEVPCEKPDQVNVGWEVAIASSFALEEKIQLPGRRSSLSAVDFEADRE